MGTTAQKLQNIIDSKAAISAAIEAKGGTVPQELSGYGPAIEALPSGGSSDLAAKIVDKTVTEVTAADLSGVRSIGRSAFYDCSGLTSITIPDSVRSIGIEAFRGCSGLTSVAIPDSVTSIGGGVFYNCSGLTSITIPDGVTSISDNAFSGCSGLTSITIPNRVTKIGSNAFQNCSGLTSITIPEGVTNIESGAFSGCSGLTSVTIPDSVTGIGWGMFQGCSGLTSITIGSGVRNIAIGAFGNCSNCLIYDFSNHTSVPSLAGVAAFQGTNANKKIIVPDDLYDSWKAANNWNSSTNGIVDAITKASEA